MRRLDSAILSGRGNLLKLLGSAVGLIRAADRYSRMSEQIDKDLLAILACPETHAPVVEHDGWIYSTDPQTRRRYPIRDGIPIMLIDESEVVDQAEFERVMSAAGRK